MRGLKHTWNKKHIANEEEELYMAGWDIVQSEVLRLMDEAWQHNLKGNQVLSDRKVKAANYQYYMFYYAYAMRQYLDRVGLVDDRCTETKLQERFNVDCFEDKLECLGIEIGTNLMNTYNELLDVFGITRQDEGCDTGCCLGVGEAIINDPDDCIANIVGDCDEQLPEETLGEFAPCEFVTEEIVFGDQSNDGCSPKENKRCN
jgi:hypothetical protein